MHRHYLAASIGRKLCAFKVEAELVPNTIPDLAGLVRCLCRGRGIGCSFGNAGEIVLAPNDSSDGAADFPLVLRTKTFDPRHEILVIVGFTQVRTFFANVGRQLGGFFYRRRH